MLESRGRSATITLLLFGAVLFVIVEHDHLVQAGQLTEEFTWTRLDYAWALKGRFGGYRPNYIYGGSDFAFPGAASSGSSKPISTPTDDNKQPDGNVDFIYENNIPMGANRWRDKLFITVPRRRAGVPSTLNYVSISNKERHNVPLIPYPNWEVNQLSSDPSNRIVSVYRIAVDVCDRMWMVDTGIVELPGNRTDIQQQSVVIIDLKTDKIIKRHPLPASVLKPASILALVTVDVTKDTCDDAYAYLPDLAGYGLIVYSLKADRSWRVTHNYFFLESLAGEFNVGGQHFQWNDGVFSVALSEIKSDGFRDMYFHSMAGTHLYVVSTRILRDEALATRSYHGNDFTNLGDRGPLSQTSATDLHKPSGVLFLSLVNQNALGCWNTNIPFGKENFHVIQRDDKKMIYPCDLKVYGDDLILLTNNMPIFLYSKLNYDETNFRVWFSSVANAISGTQCESRRTNRGNRYYG
ncbi:PREDICTED: L-dopachrome tautomerase yellow-f2-like [Nicrophorus vespilloides]|uniref:L-dopachrome tautomerase yellow-f2-like n=1 Tax=Nicrophorus vespilloides TaxID=110193 RepID=A0ABM1N689_NICVS|nr:PREDICTED: L-dopachrome tautomerase yellow-f2-like [Nicrophorus vespilloides]